jgi:hypothetical protein
MAGTGGTQITGYVLRKGRQFVWGTNTGITPMTNSIRCVSEDMTRMPAGDKARMSAICLVLGRVIFPAIWTQGSVEPAQMVARERTDLYTVHVHFTSWYDPSVVWGV